ncbi:MAG: methyl-accepting chemotaxis protein [Lachnospiraceae bacterium]|nr:methyl-accepting chemotaxis protein [Lachnospiraceae bacterium]
MKIRTKVIMLSVIPLVLLTVVTAFIVAANSKKLVENEVEAALKAACYQELGVAADPKGEYHFEVEGEGKEETDIGKTLFLKNGDKNITNDTEVMNKVKTESKIDITVFFKEIRYSTTVVKTDGSLALGTAAGKPVLDKVLYGGDTMFAKNVDVVGEKYYAFYIPIKNTGEDTPTGMVFAGKSQAVVEAEIRSFIVTIIVIAAIIVFLCILLALFVAVKMSKNINSGVEKLAAIADGDLTVDIDQNILKAKDETGAIMRSIDHLKSQLTEIVGDIVNKSDEVRDFSQRLGDEATETTEAVEQVEKAVMEIADGATSQANDTQKATESVITMGNLVEETNKNVERLTTISNGMEQSGQAATETLEELEQVNEKAKKSIDIIYDQTLTTNESAKRISEAINLITSIAEETNLLSLNASIEAARAGEQGRGFAVVASQISKLAEQSNDSAKQIEAIITSLMSDSQKAVQTMDEVNVIMKKQSEMVEKTAKIFEGVLTDIDKSRESIGLISENTKGLNESRESVVDIVQNLSAIAEENAASTEETSASTTEVSATIQEMTANAEHLNGIAQQLESSVGRFKV